jgi:hypothetical protein
MEVDMDKELDKQIEDILYQVSMECSLSTEELKLLCWRAGCAFPPCKQESSEESRDLLPDPLQDAARIGLGLTAVKVNRT